MINILYESISSTVDNDFKSRGNKVLNSFKKIKLDKSSVKMDFDNNSNFLKHMRIENGYEGYIFVDGDKLVACINVNLNTHTIQAIEITKEYKGFGLSKQIIKFAIDKLKATNLSVNKKNEVAVKIYKELGFKTYKQDDHMYYMSKNIVINKNQSLLDVR